MWDDPDAAPTLWTHAHPDERERHVPLDGRLGLVLDDLHDGLLAGRSRRRRVCRRPPRAATPARAEVVTFAARELTSISQPTATSSSPAGAARRSCLDTDSETRLPLLSRAGFARPSQQPADRDRHR